jgi:hypothetical protein
MRKYLLLMLALLGLADEASADPWRISRACRWDWVPQYFNLLGIGLPFPKSAFGQPQYDLAPKTYWSLESFTTDFVPNVQFPDVRRARNWLWATMRAWRSGYSPEYLAFIGQPPQTLPPSYFVPYLEIHSGWMVKWTTSELPFPVDYIFFRARAGTGSWPSFFNNAGYASGYGDSWTFRVQGFHFSFDNGAKSHERTTADPGHQQLRYEQLGLVRREQRQHLGRGRRSCYVCGGCCC